MQTILSVQDMTFGFPTQKIFEGISFNVYEKDRLAIIGPNGTGKTTLLKLILGRETPNRGVMALSKNITVGYLSQEVISNINNTLYEEALLVFENIIKLGKDLQKMEEELCLRPDDVNLINEYGKKQHNFEINHGYDYQYLIEMMLSKFGFSKEEFSRPISSFSGGEKTKMSFVKLLLTKPDLLILDEPTNHLDLSTIEWLETYLQSYEGTLIFVSHDRYFINSLANKIIEVEDNHIEQYRGNYDFYVKEKQTRYETQLKAYNVQQKEIARMQRFIEYFRYKPRFVARVHDREKKLEHMKVIDKPRGEDKAISIHFKGESLEGKKTLGFENLEIGYDYPLIKGINALVLGKDRLAIMGDNGTGKTTLLKCILNTLKPLCGDIVRYRNCRIGYIDQHHLDINGKETLTENMMNEFPSMGEKEIYNHLGKFNFHDDDFFKQLDMLSGGEKMRLLLSKIILREYDLLLLDEPTNHLDLLTKQALVRALDDYEGTIIFVSHDRFFVDEIANKVLYFTNGKSYYHEGNYQTFKELEQQLFLLGDEVKEEKKTEVKVKEKKNYISTSKLEDRIAKIEKTIKELKESQFDEEVYTDGKKMKEIDLKIESLKEELNALEEEYLSRA